MPSEPRQAATVVLLRGAPGGGLQTLLLKRSQRAGFFPHAWVFPGGRVDPADAAVARGEGGPGLRGEVGRLPPGARPHAVAAARECFEEAGVWLGPGTPPDSLRAGLNDRSATLLDAPPGFLIDLDRVHWWAWWITPEAEPKRYDTHFFVAEVSADEAAQAAHDEIETVDTAWVDVRRAVRRREPEAFFLAPPTFRTLEELAAHDTVESVLRAASQRPRHPIQPRLERSEAGISIILPGDPEHPSPAPAPGPSRIVWRGDGWRSEGAPG